MTLFKPAENTSAFLKMGLLGFAGSGKTYTASTTGRDLVLHMKKLGIAYADKPAMFLDTETGSDWVKPMFEKAVIALHTAKTRSFADLLTAVKEAEANGSVLIIDSISHFWKELCDSYVAQKTARTNKPRARLEFQDWAYLKGEWAKFTDLYINSSLHIILCGRAGFEYGYFENDDGKKELEKTGVKMKAEGEMGYEPSLLVLMERQQKIESGSVTAVWREGMVLKDRSTLLDGKLFVNPEFKYFLPHIQRINLGARQLGVDTSRGTHHDLGPNGREVGPVQRKIVLGETQDLLILHVPGQATAEKQRKVQLVKKHFGAGWVEVEEVMPLSDLRAGYDSLHRELEGVPSRYAALLAPEATTLELNDSLPGHSAPPAQASLKDKMLAQIAQLGAISDVLHWGAAASPQFSELTEPERHEVNAALLARQNEIAKQAQPKPKEDKPEKDKPAEPKPEGGGKARAGNKRAIAPEDALATG